MVSELRLRLWLGRSTLTAIARHHHLTVPQVPVEIRLCFQTKQLLLRCFRTWLPKGCCP